MKTELSTLMSLGCHRRLSLWQKWTLIRIDKISCKILCRVMHRWSSEGIGKDIETYLCWHLDNPPILNTLCPMEHIAVLILYTDNAGSWEMVDSCQHHVLNIRVVQERGGVVEAPGEWVGAGWAWRATTARVTRPLDTPKVLRPFTKWAGSSSRLDENIV